MVAFPSFKPFIVPELSTETILSSVELHVSAELSMLIYCPFTSAWTSTEYVRLLSISICDKRNDGSACPISTGIVVLHEP